MKKSRVVRWARPRWAAAGLVAAAWLGAGLAPADASPTLSLSPSATTVFKNQAFTVNVLAGDVADLFGYQFDVGFDPSRYRVVGVDEGPFLLTGGSTFFSPGTIDNAAGTVSFVFDSIFGGVSGVGGSGLLATIDFVALADTTGPGTIGLANVTALDSALDTIALAPVASAVVSVIPEPEVWALLPVGLLAVAAWRRRSPSSSTRARAPGVAFGRVA